MAAADTANASTSSNSPPSSRQILQQFNQLSQRQKLAGAVAVAFAIALVAGTLLWSRAPEYSVLFANFEERDGGAIVAALEQQNVPHRIESGGTAILVPAEQVHDVRLRLAAQGLPRGGLVGFEVMENQRLGASQFLEQVNYQRALEGELSRTVQAIAAVEKARVHLAMPKQSGFLRDEQKPSASVLVTLHPGRTLSKAQTAGIVHLVASSVPRMSNETVSIIDQNGKLLTGSSGLEDETGLSATQLGYVRKLEAAYLERIEALLTPFVGSANFSAQVAADVDFNRVEETAESYRPNPAPEQAIRSQQIHEELNTTASTGGVPGALTNQPPVPAVAPITDPVVGGAVDDEENPPQHHNRSATMNYELDRNIQHIRHAIGQVRRMSVAVVVRERIVTPPNGGEAQGVPLTEEEIQRITALVQGAIGYDPERGDVVAVSSAPFVSPPPLDETDRPIWKDPTYVAFGMQLAKYLLVALALAFAYFGVIRPLLRSLAPQPAETNDAEKQRTETDTISADEDFTVQLGGGAARRSFEARLERAREISREDPKAVAHLIRGWIHASNAEEKRK